ncbi:hypothetical protein [uncultured Acetobacteroides sp.]|uniref:hypothetical protein n=1 Tax=uncultured Acetobacteroides sp. TaxID=1760811 RepID=UPI0029F553A0|nr:hypothetical protein [uncultured Acetobacteroides sp.]
MRLKFLLYTAVGFLSLAICGAILKLLLLLPIGDTLFNIGMSCAQVVGLILIVINGSFVTNRKMIRIMGVFALLPIIGYFVQWYSRPHGISLQLLGLLLILILYAKTFLDKPTKEVLDYLKLIWVSSKIAASFLVVALYSTAVIVGQLANILFYTMLIYFIWISTSQKTAKETKDNEQEAIS